MRAPPDPSVKRILINVPGIGGSGPAHWQSIWETVDPEMRRFAPGSWDHPKLLDWIDALEAAVVAAPGLPVLVAHSLGCLLVAHWQAWSHQPIAGAFLVAPPDPLGASFPDEAATFSTAKTGPLRFPSIGVAGTDDPYSSPAFLSDLAAEWQSDLVLTGPEGHLNAESGLGAWPSGRQLLDRFLRSLNSGA